MLTRIFLLTLACIVLVASVSDSADEKNVPEDSSEARVLLRLNTVKTSKLLERYETLVKRELDLQDSVRSCIKSGDNRLQQYQQALREAQDDLDWTKKKLLELETEKTALTARLGKKDLPGAVPEALEKVYHALEKMLERLNRIEKRLEKMERQKQ